MGTNFNELADKMYFKLRQLEATEKECKHIMHLFGQKVCDCDLRGEAVDETTGDEFINAYLNGEEWVTTISFENYANKLVADTFEFFKSKGLDKWDVFEQIFLTLVLTGDN